MNSKAGAIRAGKAFVELGVDNTRFLKGLKLAENQLKRFGRSLENIGRTMMRAGAIATVPLAISTKIFSGFDDQMKTVQAVTSATGIEFDNLTQKAKYLGRMTSFTAAQVASGMVQLGRQGFSTAEIDKGIGSVLMLARATGTDLFEAAMLAGNTLRGFGLEVSEFQRVVDVMTATANNSAQGLTDLGESMKYAAPIADEFGMTLEQTAHALGILANVGIKGSMAGTSLRAMMTRLADPSIQKILKSIGVQVADNNGNFREFASIMKDLGRATESMTNIDRLAIFNEVFGRRSISAGAKLTTAAFDRLEKAIANAEGTAARTSQTMDNGIGGSFRRLLSATEGIAIAIGSSLSKPLMSVSKWFTKIANRVAEWIDRNQELVIVIGAAAAGLLTLGSVVAITGVLFKTLSFQMGAINTISKLLSGSFKIIAGVAMAVTSPIGLVTAAAIGLGSAWVIASKNSEKAILGLTQKVLDFTDRCKRSWVEIAEALKNGNLRIAAKIAWLQIKLEWTRGISTLLEKWLGFQHAFISAWYDTCNAFLMASTDIWEKFDLAVIASSSLMQKAFTTVIANLKSEFAGLKTIWFQMKWQDKENRVTRPQEDKEIAEQKAKNAEQKKKDPSFDLEAADRDIDGVYQRQRNKRYQEYVQQSDDLASAAKDIDDAKNQKLAKITQEYNDRYTEITETFDAMRQVIAGKSVTEKATLEAERKAALADNQSQLKAALDEWNKKIDPKGAGAAAAPATTPAVDPRSKEGLALARAEIRKRIDELKTRNQELAGQHKGILGDRSGLSGLSEKERQAMRAAKQSKAAPLASEISNNKAEMLDLMKQVRRLGSSPADVMRAAGAAGGAMRRTWEESNATIAGSFSSQALGGLASGGIAKMMADAAMRTAENTGKIVDLMGDGEGGLLLQ